MPVSVLAYSGGLDTSTMLGWLIERGHEVHAVYVDLGQPVKIASRCMTKQSTLARKAFEWSMPEKNCAVTLPFQY